MGEDGFSIEEAYRVMSKHGSLETFKRDLNKVGGGKWWMYTEEYFYPRQFYLMKVGPNYSNTTPVAEVDLRYLVVTDASRLGLSVYARDPMEYYQKYNKDIQSYLQQMGFGGKVYWNAPRPIYQGGDCDWPSEKELFARRVLKNYEMSIKERSSTPGTPLVEMISNYGNGTTKAPVEIFAEVMKNPQAALQKLFQSMNMMA